MPPLQQGTVLESVVRKLEQETPPRDTYSLIDEAQRGPWRFELYGKEILRFEPDGRVFVRGECVDDNGTIYGVLREFYDTARTAPIKAAREVEREAIVAWLRSEGRTYVKMFDAVEVAVTSRLLADAIEEGEHLKAGD